MKNLFYHNWQSEVSEGVCSWSWHNSNLRFMVVVCRSTIRTNQSSASLRILAQGHRHMTGGAGDAVTARGVGRPAQSFGAVPYGVVILVRVERVGHNECGPLQKKSMRTSCSKGSKISQIFYQYDESRQRREN